MVAFGVYEELHVLIQVARRFADWTDVYQTRSLLRATSDRVELTIVFARPAWYWPLLSWHSRHTFSLWVIYRLGVN